MFSKHSKNDVQDKEISCKYINKISYYILQKKFKQLKSVQKFLRNGLLKYLFESKKVLYFTEYCETISAQECIDFQAKIKLIDFQKTSDRRFTFSFIMTKLNINDIFHFSNHFVV